MGRPRGGGSSTFGHGAHALIHAGHGLSVFLRTPVLPVRPGGSLFQTSAQRLHMSRQPFHQRTQLARGFLQTLPTG